jgi:hypothetical protein
MSSKFSGLSIRWLNVVCAVSFFCVLGHVSVVRAQSWSLSGNWDGVSNPNGPWNYGYLSGSTYGSLGQGNNGAYGYSNYLNSSGAFIYKNQNSVANVGIDPGQISLESNFGTPDVRFVAPVSGVYVLDLAVGGTTSYEDTGYGNFNADRAGLLVNGVSIPYSSSAGNVYSWDLSEPLAAGNTVDVYVGVGYGGGDTQAIFTVSVPEPTSVGLAAGAFSLPLIRRHKKT